MWKFLVENEDTPEIKWIYGYGIIDAFRRTGLNLFDWKNLEKGQLN